MDPHNIQQYRDQPGSPALPLRPVFERLRPSRDQIQNAIDPHHLCVLRRVLIVVS